MTILTLNFKDGKKEQKDLLGGKGANLAEMMSLGLPVPEGFTVTTDACGVYFKDKQVMSKELLSQIEKQIKVLEQQSGKGFGDKKNPLLLSVRSGAKISMPGMMDTVLNLGLNSETLKGLIELTGNERFALDSFRRFIQMFSDVVYNLDKHAFEKIVNDLKKSKGYDTDLDMTSEDIKKIIEDQKTLFKKLSGKEFPEDTNEQLIDAVKAVFDSWENERAIIYRNLNNIPHDIYTAVNIQSMVFGNMGDDSGTGVLFTRNPIDGTNEIYGEYLMNAQGEDVVAGIRTPEKISLLAKQDPSIYKEIEDVVSKLEKHYKDMQDIEFTIEKSKLYILQTRNGKRTGLASINIAIDMFEDKLINKEDAIMMVDPSLIDQLLHPSFDVDELNKSSKITQGLPASPGAGVGAIVFDSNTAKEWAEAGKKVVLVREETSPEDIQGMHSADAIVTSTGGATSHAAVVARGMGKCCVVGCHQVHIDGKTLEVSGTKLKEGDIISVDGTTGKIYKGAIKTQKANPGPSFEKFIKWCDEAKILTVKANADNPEDVKTALEFGAKGVGLCRTEHMFFEADRINIVRKMILSQTTEDRIKALDELYKFQLEDFKNIYKISKELPVTIRLLDPPLHEFLPHSDVEIEEVAKLMNIKSDEVKRIINSMSEVNPMLGHRGCRLAVSYPEIYKMQVRSIINAALEINKELKINIVPEIKLPLISNNKELLVVKDDILEEITSIKDIETLKYEIGVMIEVPRAALRSDSIAAYSDFFSFGTNDLTQMTYGFSRDDSSKFMEDYVKKGIFVDDPFKTLDIRGVGKMVQISTELGRERNKDIRIGICGEHGGDPKSIEFFDKIGLDYISCSPYRVYVAIVSAAQAAIKNKAK